jgi:hypothetical protein
LALANGKHHGHGLAVSSLKKKEERKRRKTGKKRSFQKKWNIG